MDSQINKLISDAIFTRYSGRSSFGRVDYYNHAGKHILGHCQHLHTTSKLLHRRIQPSHDHHGGIQVLQILKTLCYRAWCLALTLVLSTGIHQQFWGRYQQAVVLQVRSYLLYITVYAILQVRNLDPCGSHS